MITSYWTKYWRMQTFWPPKCIYDFIYDMITFMVANKVIGGTWVADMPTVNVFRDGEPNCNKTCILLPFRHTNVDNDLIKIWKIVEIYFCRGVYVIDRPLCNLIVVSAVLPSRLPNYKAVGWLYAHISRFRHVQKSGGKANIVIIGQAL